MIDSYRENRKRIYEPLKEEGIFTWDSFDGEEYALASIHQINGAFREEIALATEKLGAIFFKMGKAVQQGSDELLDELGIPKEAFASVRINRDLQVPTVVGRFDFANTAQGLKMLEFNSDTPTTIVEAYHVNEHICRFYNMRNPNHRMKQDIEQAFQHMVNVYKSLGYSCNSIYFSSLDWYIEDKGTTRYLMDQSGLMAKYVSLSSLAVKEDKLLTFDQETQEYYPIDLLYRLHALELLAKDKDSDGYPTGEHVLNLIANKKLAIINPPCSLICQTKALQALIWSLYEANLFFDKEEREIIHTYMLPTYLENLFHGKIAYVKKPIFGREGGAVTLFDGNGLPVATDTETYYWDQKMIYQEKVDLEVVEVTTNNGMLEGNLLWGSFLLNGKASAMVARIDRQITGDNAYYLPVGMVN